MVVRVDLDVFGGEIAAPAGGGAGTMAEGDGDGHGLSAHRSGDVRGAPQGGHGRLAPFENTHAAQIDGDRVRVLAEHAITEEKIDEHAVEAAMKKAEEALKAAKDMDPQQYEHLQSLVRYSGVQLAVKRRRR